MLTRIRTNTMSFAIAIAIVVLMVQNMISVINWDDLVRRDRDVVEERSAHRLCVLMTWVIVLHPLCTRAIVLLSTLHQVLLLVTHSVTKPLFGRMRFISDQTETMSSPLGLTCTSHWAHTSIRLLATGHL